jgi:hypothetical protein
LAKSRHDRARIGKLSDKIIKLSITIYLDTVGVTGSIPVVPTIFPNISNALIEGYRQYLYPFLP